MLLRVHKHLCFSFCNINFHRYLAAEKILQTVLNHDKHIKEDNRHFLKNLVFDPKSPVAKAEIPKE